MDQESRDANSLLVELDRGLQSQSIGDQTEAVVRFTSLFQRYPLPILINSACLKLSEAFRYGSNFIRVQICEVLERNQSHLNKIYNVDDFYRNIFTVTTSNDPIARSITLLTLGNIAPIVSGYKSIHHCVSSSLESTVECELKATIACAASYVKQSAEFACNIYPKIVSIINSSRSSTDVKIRALSVLDHGFYNANDAMIVRSFLIDVIENSKLKRLICTCSTLSTKIAYTSLSHIMPQIEFLLDIFLNNKSRLVIELNDSKSRLVIKLNALRNLKFLAEKSPHIWESSHVDPLVTYMERSLSNKRKKEASDNDEDVPIRETEEKDIILCNILSIFCKLLTCKCNFISQHEKTRIFQQCYKLALNNQNILLCSMAFELLTVMSEEYSSSSTKNMIEYQSSDLTMDTFTAIQTFITNSAFTSRLNKSTKKDKTSNLQQVRVACASKAIYRHIVNLCQLNPHYCPELLKLIFTRISVKDASLDKLPAHITELMCAIHQSCAEPIIMADNCWKLIKSKASEMSETNLLNLYVLYFQTLRLRSSHTTVDCLVDKQILCKITQDHGLWFGFKVMRQAMRYGHYKIASAICDQLHEDVTTDTTDFYFKSLGRICTAEFILVHNQDLDSNLRSAIPLYEEAVSPFRASIGNSRTTNFQLQFLWLRIRNLQAHSTLRQCCMIHEVSPITYATLLNAIGATRGSCDPGLTKLGTIQQMPKIAKDFRYLGECYENLSLVSFNCDNSTLNYIHLLKSSCIIMADVIDAIFQYGKNLPVISKVSPMTTGSNLALEHRELERICNKLIESIRCDILKPGIFPSTKSIDPLIILLRTFSNEILKCPFVYPRYFFQPLQMTQIKLAITPQHSQTSGCIALMLNNNLVLKVEGLIQNLSKTQVVIRKISKVVISVTKTSTKPVDPNFNLFVQSTAKPHNNYFKTEFLLPLKWAGSFNVDIDVSIIDEQERLWKTGPSERLNLIVS